MDSSFKQNLIDMSSTPCELWCYRDADLIHAGPLTDFRIQGRSIQLTSRGLLAYIGYMIRDTAYTASGLDQATIVKALIDTYQAQTFGNYGLVTTTLTATGVTRDLNLLASDLKHIDQVIAEMGNRANGFDLFADPLTREVSMFSPRQGTDKSATVIIDGRSIGNPSYSQSVGPGQIASDVVVTSSSATGGNLTSSAPDVVLRASFGRAMLSSAFSDVSQQATLNDHATRLIDDYSSALHQVSPGLLAVPGFAYTDIEPGDQLQYSYDAGLGVQTFVLRIKTLSTNVDSGTERLTIGFF